MPGPKEVLLVEPLNWQEEGRGDGKRHSDEVSGGWQTGLRRTLPLRQFRPRPVLFSCNDVSVCVCVCGGWPSWSLHRASETGLRLTCPGKSDHLWVRE